MSNGNEREVQSFSYERMRKQATIPLIVVYDHPTDYPDAYVARLWDANRPTNIIATADTLDGIHAKLPGGMMRMERDPRDDPVIIESWI